MTQNYVLSRWYAAAWHDEIGDTLFSRKICDMQILLFRDEHGKASALLDRCPHRLVPLSMGQKHGGNVTCGYHGLEFAPTGKCVNNPHGPITSALSVRSFPLVERDKLLWIWLGDPAETDESLLPDFGFLNQAEMRPVTGYMHTAANYQLISDNILDLSHIEFLHAQTLGTEAIRSAQIQAWQDGETVYSDRTAVDEILTPFLERTFETGGRPVKRWLKVRWDPPGLMKLTVGVSPAGPEQGARETFGSHMVTPETQETSHYFWSHTRNFGPDDPELDRQRKAGLERAFTEEDKPMIEAQQKIIGTQDLSALGPALLKQDSASVLARRTIAKLTA